MNRRWRRRYGLRFYENVLEFGEEREEECRVETMSLSSSNKQIKEMRSDAFSELPDSLLIHILSFLDVKSAGITSVLSKRWKYLWAESPNLVFLGNEVTCWGTDPALNFVSWVNRTIAIRQGNYLETFAVDFVYECCDSDVDVWVEFSVKNNVKELILSLDNFPKNTSYTLPQVIYSCSSLTTVYLLGCSMAYEGTIAWQCLTSLTLYEVMLNQHLVDEILSNCPVLNDLELRLCWGFDRLEVNSRCLNSLTIEEFEIDPFVEISAPCMRSLSIAVFRQGKKWQLRNISSVVSASINFLEGGDGSEEVIVNVKEFLENFKHVNDLHIHHLCFEVLSEIAVNGLQLPQFRLRHLTINSCSEYELCISGIIYLLKSSPNIETLILGGLKTNGEIFILDPAEMGDLDSDLLHLKKIRVNNFADPNGEPLLTLAQILLRRAPVLEEMAIEIDVQDTSSIINICQTLLTYPRSSPKAEIHLAHK